MAVIKKIGIKNSSGTGYDSRDIGAEAENIIVSYDANNTVTNTTDANNTKTLDVALKEIQNTTANSAPKVHSSSISEYGAASTSNYGHVKINANSGLTVSNGAIGVNFAADGSAEDTNAVVRANDSRLNSARNNEHAVTFSNGLSIPTTKDYDGSSALTVTYSDVGAAPTSHASTATTYGAATTSAYGHIKPGTGLNIESSAPGVLNVSYGTTATTACAGNDSRLSDARTPKSHAATTTSYGGGTASNYGHVMLTDDYSVSTPSAATNGAATSIAASAYALQQAYNTLNNNFLNKVYPVGAIYMSMNSTSPATLFGGTWTRIQSRFLLAADDSSYKVNTTGGEAAHTLTVNEMPAHRHNNQGYWTQYMATQAEINASDRYAIAAYPNSGSKVASVQNADGTIKGDGNNTNALTNTGGGQAHNNMPPYLAVYMWQRTA